MKFIMKLITFLCLTGLLPVSVSFPLTIPHKYDLILKTMAWPDAQKYCRVTYNDLATMLSQTDWLRLKTETTRKRLTTSAWTGLYKDIYNWRWTLNNLPLKNVTFTDWYPGQPDNYYGNEACGIIAAYQQWYDVQCNLIRPFICYDATVSDANKFIGISSPQLSWPDAQTYCRTNHTDLASPLNSSDDAILDQIKINQGDSWIGLTRDLDIWKWSDGTNALNIPWNPGQPDNYYGSENCAVIYYSRFYDERCTNLHYFFSQTFYPMRSQIMKLQAQSDGSVFDPAVQSSILDQVKQKLEENGMLKYINVSWRVQPDGNIFYKFKKDKL